MTKFVQFLVSTATTGSVLALVAVGYNLIYSTTRIINFAQAYILVAASYTAFYFSFTRPAGSTGARVNGLGWPIGLALVAAGGGSPTRRALLGSPGPRPPRGVRPPASTRL